MKYQMVTAMFGGMLCSLLLLTGGCDASECQWAATKTAIKLFKQVRHIVNTTTLSLSYTAKKMTNFAGGWWV